MMSTPHAAARRASSTLPTVCMMSPPASCTNSTRPSFVDLWRDLRAVGAEIRPDWDLNKPGLREASDAGDYSPFHGWNKRAPQSVPTCNESLASEVVTKFGRG